jgi:hypothetical protein
MTPISPRLRDLVDRLRSVLADNLGAPRRDILERIGGAIRAERVGRAIIARIKICSILLDEVVLA